MTRFWKTFLQNTNTLTSIIFIVMLHLNNIIMPIFQNFVPTFVFIYTLVRFCNSELYIQTGRWKMYHEEK